MKVMIFLLSIFWGNFICGQNVGINTDTPNAILEIKANEIIADKTIDGVIIPRVSTLDWRANAVGQLIFLEKENIGFDRNQRGFYWWNGTEWVHILSKSQAEANRAIVYARISNNFAEGSNFTQNIPNETKTLIFDETNLKSFNHNDFSIENGALVVRRAGYYNVNASVSLSKSGSGNIRDTFDFILLVNGFAPSFQNDNLDLKASQTFNIGNNITIPLIGVLRLNAGDRISFQVVKSANGNRRSETNSAIISIASNRDSNLTMQYLGDF